MGDIPAHIPEQKVRFGAHTADRSRLDRFPPDGGSRSDGPLMGFQDGNVDNLPRCQAEPACVFENGHPGRHGTSFSNTTPAFINWQIEGALVDMAEIGADMVRRIEDLQTLIAEFLAVQKALIERVGEMKL